MMAEREKEGQEEGFLRDANGRGGGGGRKMQAGAVLEGDTYRI